MNASHPYPHAQQYLQDNLPAYLRMLRQMVEINSFTYNAAGVNALGKLTADIFAPLGFEAQFVQSAYPEFGKHLVLRKPGTGQPQAGGKTIGLISHLDTVFPPEEEAANDFRWREAGDRIYGPGTVDIKGGTVVIYMMLDALRKFAPQQYAEATFVVLVNASEEMLCDDFGEVCAQHLVPEAQAALVFEGGHSQNGRCSVVVARKGRATYHVTVEGKSSHAGSAH
ncbi:MAG: M20 family metallopeptidase, partial [Chloroflexi bacterium]|nr:M20 family metallopeptidase [Chloroflexota bacterium]